MPILSVNSLKRSLICALASVLFTLPAVAFETRATAAYVYDMGTSTILVSKNADKALPPASMSKLMTLYIAFEALRDGRLRLDERLSVSSHAMSYGGSTMFLDTSDRVAVEDLLRGIIVLSGNDACAVIAEALSPDGSEAGFARYMTDRAKALGMTQSTFVNSNGWPAAGHRMSMHDLGILAERIIRDFPEYYPLFSEREFAFDGRAPQNSQNRNPLLGLGIGADGLKTGHTSEAGYGLVGSAKQGERRIIFVISGLDSTAARAEEAEKIVTWAFRQFVEKQVGEAGKIIAEAPVWMGAADRVGLTTAEDLSLLIPVIGENKMAAEAIYDAPVSAPIAKGDAVGHLLIRRDGLPDYSVALVAAETVEPAGVVGKLKATGTMLLKRAADRDAAQ